MNSSSPLATCQQNTPFLALAPFLRMSIAGVDIRPVAQENLARIQSSPDDANLWMNLSTVMQCVGQRDIGLSAQAEALALERLYDLPAVEQPAKLRLLMLMAPGDLAENTPIDCLLENSDIDLVFYYVTPDQPLPSPVPRHDAVMVGISDSAKNRIVLAALEPLLAVWPKPVINPPRSIPTTERSIASDLLQGVPGLLIPPTRRAARMLLQAIGAGQALLPDLFRGCDFPIILRPVGSQAGRDLAKIECAGEIAAYLSQVDVTETEFFVARFIDYRGPDGLFRKARVALIDGRAYACHMALSANWMVHYVNANMYEDAWKRSQEIAFMEHFDDFVQRHREALATIHQRTGLDYLCLDCAETSDGQLLIFEIDHVMVVHAMDTEELFPYKQHYMQKVKSAFREYLLRLTAGHSPAIPA